MSEQCNDPLNIRGEGFNCDRTLGHPLPHMSKLAGAIWSSDDCAAAEAVVLDERARIQKRRLRKQCAEAHNLCLICGNKQKPYEAWYCYCESCAPDRFQQDREDNPDQYPTTTEGNQS